MVLALDRFLRLGSFGIWYDEALTWAAYEGSIAYEPLQYPLWYPAVRATLGLLGGATDAFSLRLLSATSGVLGVVLTWWAFHPVVGRRVSASAALLLAASPWHLYLSQTARPYATALAFSILGAGFVLRGLVRRSVALVALGLVASVVAALFHPSAIIGTFACAMLVWGVVCRSKAWRWVQAGCAAAALLGGAALASWAHTGGELPILRSEPDPLHFVLTFGYRVDPIVLTGCAVATALAVRRRLAPAASILAVCIIIVGSGVALSCFVRITARYVLWALPWMMVLAALPVGAHAFAAREGTAPQHGGGPWSWAYLALLVLPQLPQTALYFTAWNGNRSHWREAYELVERRREPGEFVVGHAYLVGRYYIPKAPGSDDPSVLAIEHWKDVVEHHAAPGETVWFVIREEEIGEFPPSDPPALEKFLKERCRRVEDWLLVPTMGRDLSVDVYAFDR